MNIIGKENIKAKVKEIAETLKQDVSTTISVTGSAGTTRLVDVDTSHNQNQPKPTKYLHIMVKYVMEITDYNEIKYYISYLEVAPKLNGYKHIKTEIWK